MKVEGVDKKIFVGGIPSFMQKDEVLGFFRNIIPDLEKVELPLSRSAKTSSSPRNKGFAIVCLRDENLYQRLLEKKFLYIRKRKITLRPYLKGDKLKSKKKEELMKKVFISRLPQDLNLKIVKSKLEEKFGEIDDIFRLVNPITKKPKTCCFCYFKKVESAGKALRSKTLLISSKKLVIEPFDQQMSNKFKKSKFGSEKNEIRSSSKPSNEKEQDLHHCKPTLKKYFQLERPLPDHRIQMLRLNKL